MPSVKVLQSVSHGRYNLHAGEVRHDVGQGDVNTLKELGFVEDHDTLDELVGGEKMDDAVQNKMEPAPTNKGKK